MSDAAIDPVQTPEAYRRQLLDMLGDDDPAKVQAATVGRLRELVREAGDRLRVRPDRPNGRSSNASATSSTPS